MIKCYSRGDTYEFCKGKEIIVFIKINHEVKSRTRQKVSKYWHFLLFDINNCYNKSEEIGGNMLKLIKEYIEGYKEAYIFSKKSRRGHNKKLIMMKNNQEIKLWIYQKKY